MFQTLLLRHRRWFASLAILAVLMNALAPGLSQAMQAMPVSGERVAGAWFEVCSADGSRWLKLDASGQVVKQSSTRPADAPASAHGDACGYCLPHAASFALLDTAPSWGRQVPAPDTARAVSPPQEAGIVAPPWTRPALRAPPQA